MASSGESARAGRHGVVTGKWKRRAGLELHSVQSNDGSALGGRGKYVDSPLAGESTRAMQTLVTATTDAPTLSHVCMFPRTPQLSSACMTTTVPTSGDEAAGGVEANVECSVLPQFARGLFSSFFFYSCQFIYFLKSPRVCYRRSSANTPLHPRTRTRALCNGRADVTNREVTWAVMDGDQMSRGGM